MLSVSLRYTFLGVDVVEYTWNLNTGVFLVTKVCGIAEKQRRTETEQQSIRQCNHEMKYVCEHSSCQSDRNGGSTDDSEQQRRGNNTDRGAARTAVSNINKADTDSNKWHIQSRKEDK